MTKKAASLAAFIWLAPESIRDEDWWAQVDIIRTLFTLLEH
jgi:hypothetical protein